MESRSEVQKQGYQSTQKCKLEGIAKLSMSRRSPVTWTLSCSYAGVYMEGSERSADPNQLLQWEGVGKWLGPDEGFQQPCQA